MEIMKRNQEKCCHSKTDEDTETEEPELEKDPDLKCPICPKTLKSHEELESHEWEDHGIMVCKYCYKIC